MYVVLTRYCYRKSSVRLWRWGIVCIGWTSSKIVTWVIRQSNPMGTPPKTSGEIGVRSLFSADNLQHLCNGARSDQGYYWRSIGSRIRAFDLCQNQRPLVYEGPLCTLFQNTCTHHEYLNEDTPVLSANEERCSLMTLVSGNISLMRIFVGDPWRWGSNNSGR